MNKPKFRALNKKSNEWVYGVPIPNGLSKRVFMICLTLDVEIAYPLEQLHDFCVEVIPETIGQYTGLKDKNGVEIYEGDIVKTVAGNIQVVVFVVGSKTNVQDSRIAQFNCYDNRGYFHFDQNDVVIGNIHENPELLSGVSD